MTQDKDEAALAWEERAGSAQFPPRPYPIDSSESKASERDYFASVKSLKKMFWRQKVRSTPDKLVNKRK